MCGGMVAIPPAVKEKRRNSEKRKEKSRDAARCRRSKESEIFYELSSQLPVPTNTASQLDKASVMRLTVGFLKVRHMLEMFLSGDLTISTTALDSFYSKALRGFLLILAEEGNIIYLSENVEDYLGLSQVEMMGHSIFEFTHPCDHEEIKTLLTPERNGSADVECQTEPISFFIRMKSTVPLKGRPANLKSASYQVIHCIGHKFSRPALIDSDEDSSTYYVVSIGEPIPHPSQIDVPFDKQIFFSRHSPDMKFTDVDERIGEFLGYSSSDLVGKSVYPYYHASDTSALDSCFKTLFSKGQCETGYYRFLAKYGGYVWILTQFTLIYENSTKPECVVCLNYVLSKIENADEIVSSEQVNPGIKGGTPSHIAAPQVVPPFVVEVSNTESIFASNEVMNKSYHLTFPDTDLLLFHEPLKDSKLPLELDLFQDDPCSLGSSIHDDPFISYRDDSLSSPSYCGTPDSSLPRSSSSGSPDHFSTTPSTPDSSSLQEIPSLDPIDEFANLDLKLSMSPTISDKDCDVYESELNFALRAPYIPMNMDDDFPLMSPSNSVMWGPQEPIPKRAPDDSPVELGDPPLQSPKTKAPVEPFKKSSLAALLQSDLKKHPVSRHEKTKSPTRRELLSQKKWPNSHSIISDNVKNNSNGITRVSGGLQKHFNTPRNGSSNGGNGHIIMLDTIPSKKHPPSGKSNCHRRNGHSATSAPVGDHSQTPTLGSHTATVKVNDRLIKVQVSVSELPALSIEQKQPFPSPPDPPPKRSSPSLPGSMDSPKRLKFDSNVVCTGAQAVSTDSVLLNLLISGEDASRGYLCSGNSRYSDRQFEPAVISLPAHITSQSDSLHCPALLASESELLDSFLNISQYDTDVNAPIQSSHLLQGEDLLNALDHQPLRDVPTLV